MSKLTISENFLSVGNLKPKLKSFFKPKLKPKLFYCIGPQGEEGQFKSFNATEKVEPKISH